MPCCVINHSDLNCSNFVSHNSLSPDEGDLAAVERASTLSIDIKDAQAFYAGIYQCVVSNAAGKVKSRAARLSLGKTMFVCNGTE